MNNRSKTIYVGYFLLLCLTLWTARGFSQNQVTFTITNTPLYTPSNDSLYLCASIDNWLEKDTLKKFKQYPDGHYRLTLNLGDVKNFEYKINRGNWDRVEGNDYGDYMPNRKFAYNDSVYEVKIQIASWQDLHQKIFLPIEVIVTSVPQNTPHDASIYLSGSFNRWIKDDSYFKLTKKEDGTYVGSIPAGYDSIAFTFTRGTWQSTEARWDGGMCSNRAYIASQANNNTIKAVIYNWRDLSPKPLWPKTFFLLFLLQSLLAFALLLRHGGGTKLKVLSVFMALAFFVKFFTLNYQMLYLFPKLYFVPSLIYGFICTWAYASITLNLTKKNKTVRWIYLLPLVQVLWYVRYLFVPNDVFYLQLVDNEYIGLLFTFYAYGLAIQLYLGYRLKNATGALGSKIPNYIRSCYSLYKSTGIVTVLIIGVAAVAIVQGVEIKFIADWTEHLIWIGMGIILICAQWYFFTNNSVAHNTKWVSKDGLNEESRSRLKLKLSKLMAEKKLYTDPELTLSDLAGRLGTNNQYLSKVINEGFKKSYTDYINDYRIEAFIDAVENEKDNRTFLYHAYQVGFNSKSAFNRSFKKIKHTTPSSFFAEHKNKV